MVTGASRHSLTAVFEHVFAGLWRNLHACIIRWQAAEHGCAAEGILPSAQYLTNLLNKEKLISSIKKRTHFHALIVT